MHTEKSIQTIASELTQFFITRAHLLKSEMSEKGQTLKQAVPSLCIAGVLLMTGWLVLTYTLVDVVHFLFVPNAYSWIWASLIVGIAYMVLGGGVAQMALKAIKATNLAPTRTLTVLKQDRAWIENEVRAA